MLIRRTVLLGKIESSYNTDSVPTGVDAALIEDFSWSNAGLKMVERLGVRESISPLQGIYAGRLLQTTFTAEVKGSGSAGVAPEIGPFLVACGLEETVVASTSVTYTPRSSSFDSITQYIYEDGKRIKVTGCRGNVSFAFTAGGIIKATFTMTGHVAAQTDQSIITATLDSTVPEPFIGASFTVDGFAGVIESLSFDMGNTVATPVSANESDGYGEILITARKVSGTINPEDELVATEDWVGNFTSGSNMVLGTGAIGGTAGNIVELNMPSVYYMDATPGDRDGVRVFDLPFGATGDDAEVELIFT